MKSNHALRYWKRISRMRPAKARTALAVATVLAAAIITIQPMQAQTTFTTLASFDGTNGSYSLAPLIQATNGNLYGTTNQATDGSGYGNIFEITTGGTLTSLYSFCKGGPPCSDGYGPVPGLVQTTNGDLYGTTEYGGSTDGGLIDPFGTVFKVTPGGTLTTLYSFGVQDACAPLPTAGLVQATNGDFYGTTQCGGVNGSGTVFKITPAGVLTTLYNFCGAPSCGMGQPTDADGFVPVAGLIQATNGDLYGVTTAGGANRGNQVNGGTIFKMSLSGKLTTLYSFCAQTNCADGLSPASMLVQASNGNIYGTTYSAGANGFGTIFEITTSGKFKFKTLYSFCSKSNCADGQNGGNPSQPALIQATDGNLYGTTPYGGNTTSGVSTNGWGTIFKITPTGTFTTLYTFCTVSGCPDGGEPYGGLFQDTNGTFYGTTAVGGANSPGDGTVYSFSVGLGPFVETLPTSGKIGAKVEILGTDLTGATSVTFNGIASAFTVASSSEIKTTVPTGATSGKVQVTTPAGILTSNVSFQVL